MNIYLIGYRCTGKTSVGRMLAEQLGWRFVDTDHYIVEKAGRSISELVAAHGWEFFRQKEKQALTELNSHDQLVLATGGGIILDPANLAILKDDKNFVIWLQADAETIYHRMKEDEQSDAFRPALTESPLFREIQETLTERRSYYESAADLAVNTDQLALNKACGLILKQIKERH
ncbi:MAG: shikimate kinase [Desulfobacterales bacterium]